jgi:hypothetical protein
MGSNPQFIQWMRDAFQAYQSGKPVVIMNKSGGVIHGIEELAAVGHLTSAECFVVRNVDVDQWNASEWPDVLQAAREVYLLGKRGEK